MKLKATKSDSQCLLGAGQALQIIQQVCVDKMPPKAAESQETPNLAKTNRTKENCESPPTGQASQKLSTRDSEVTQTKNVPVLAFTPIIKPHSTAADQQG